MQLSNLIVNFNSINNKIPYDTNNQTNSIEKNLKICESSKNEDHNEELIEELEKPLYTTSNTHVSAENVINDNQTNINSIDFDIQLNENSNKNQIIGMKENLNDNKTVEIPQKDINTIETSENDKNKEKKNLSENNKNQFRDFNVYLYIF